MNKLNTIITGMLVGMIASSTAFASEADLKNEIEKLKTQNGNIEQQLQQLLTQVKEQPKAVENTGATIGGYGEIIYNSYSNDSSRSQMDFRRFVLSVNKVFNDQWSFNGEAEWEHAVAADGEQGEAAIEQAYISYQATKNLNMKFGLILMPFGFLNESHEPPVFYGVERNEVERRIIPTTWREGGISLAGTTDSNLEWGLGIVTGFDVAKFDNAGKPLGAIRQELQLAKARDLSYFATLNYKVPGFVAGVGVFTGNSGQGNADYQADSTKPNFDGIKAPITLADAHVRYQQGGWDAQALIAKGTIGEADQINNIIQAYNIATPASIPAIASEFYGWLVQAAYVIPVGQEATIAPFARYEEYDTQAKMPAGFAASPTNSDHVTTTGFNYKPISQVVFKADYQNYNDNSVNNRFNLGMGYMF